MVLQKKLIIFFGMVAVSTIVLFVFASRFGFIESLAPIKKNEAVTNLEKFSKNSDKLGYLITKEADTFCSFSLQNPNDPSSNIEGKFYISNKSIRFDLTITNKNSNEITQNAYLEKDGYGYTWFKDKGVKFKLESNESIFSEKYISPDIIKLIDLSNNLSCSTKELDSKLFNIPKNIAFSDIEENIENAKSKIDSVIQKMKGEVANYCSKCNALQDDDLIKSCRKMRGCE